MIKQGKSKKYGFILNYDDSDMFVGNPVAFDDYEPYESELFLKNVNRNSIVLDVGANIGYYSMLAHLAMKRFSYKKRGAIYSFEPNMKNFLLLEKNIKDNKSSNIFPYNVAVGDKTCESVLYLSDENQGDHRLYDDSGVRKGEKCNQIPLDLFCQQNNVFPDVVKIDTQGYDLFVLNGMNELLNSNKNLTVFTEFWAYGNQRSGASSVEYFDLLKKHFKDVCFIDELNKDFYPVDYDFVMKECSKNDGYNHANLYCKR